MPAPVSLRRVLTFWPLLLYGLGVIVGAGVYVTTGEVIERAGDAAPVSFLVAGLAAGLTGLCYAELAARFPEAAGAASYVRHGLASDRLALAVAAATTLAVAIAAASIAHGAVLYLAEVLPLPPALLTATLIVSFTAVAALGVRASVGLAAAVGALEIGGLVAAMLIGLLIAPDLRLGEMVPTRAAAWPGILSGAFIAFFAFIGFETLANMAEEVKDPRRTLPRGIIGAVAASTLLYVAVTAAVVLSGTRGANPLLRLFEGRGASAFAVAAAISVANGVMVEIIMLARLFYGMARNRQLPAAFGAVHPWTQTPVFATAVAGGLVLSTALLFPFQHLLAATNVLTLAIFAVVDLTLWRLHRVDASRPRGFRVPDWVPPAAALTSLALIAAEFLA